MKRQKPQSLRAGNLRPQAERRLQEKGNSDADDLARTDFRAVVHELQVHQIDLEMQNDELRRAQAQAEEAQQKYAELFDFAPAGYFVVDQDGLIREANLAGAALLGRDRSRLIGQPFTKFVAPGCRPQFAAFWGRLREADTRRSCELTLLKQGQGLRPVILEAAVLSGVEGGGMRFLLAVTDITARKQAEEARNSVLHGLERHLEERTTELQRSNVGVAHEIEKRKQAEEDVAEQLRIETLLADLSAHFVNVPADELDREIMDAQRRLCEFLGLDMSALRQWSEEDPDTFTLTYFYSAQWGPQPPRKLKQEAFPWIVQQVRAGRNVAFASLEDLPAEAARDRESARQLGVRSSLCLPLSVGGKPIGILALNTTRAKRDWPEALVRRLNGVAHMLASALARKRADQALRASQERLSLAADAAEAGAWELDCQTQVFWVTDKTRVLLGYPPGEVVTMARLKTSVHPDDWDLVQRSLDRSLQAGEPLNLEYRIRFGDGGERWIASRGRPSFKPTGEPDRLLALSIDITERKRTEAVHRASEARLAVGTELAGLGHHEVDYGNGTCFVDDRIQEICGVPAGQHSSLQPLQFFMDHLHPDDRQFFMDERQKMHDGKVEHLSIEYRYLHPTEGQKWIHHLTRVASRDASGRALRTVGVLRNITERKTAERALIESNERFRRVLEASPSGMVLVDEKGRMTLVNAQIQRLFGYTREELIGQAVDLLVPDRFRAVHQVHRANFHQAPAVRMMGQGRELFGRRKDGTEFPLEIGLSSIQGPEGVLVLAAVVDLSVRKQAEAEASRQRAELAHVARVSTMGELAASVAHELNQPLGAILANTEAAELFLRQDPPALGELGAILADIRQDDERAGEVIRRMRALLRKSELERQPLEINSVVEDVLRVVSGDAALRKTAISADLAPLLPKILGDRVHLQQVLLNLILNGMDAVAEQPRERRRLSVRTRPGADGLVELLVTDLGHGIEPDKLPRLFEPFYTTKTNGMGMGLSIARRIIDAHRGRIWVENHASGGAAFYITIPAVQEERADH